MEWIALLIPLLVEIFANCDFASGQDVREKARRNPIRFRFGVLRAIRQAKNEQGDERLSVRELNKLADEVVEVIETSTDDELGAFCGMCQDYRATRD